MAERWGRSWEVAAYHEEMPRSELSGRGGLRDQGETGRQLRPQGTPARRGKRLEQRCSKHATPSRAR